MTGKPSAPIAREETDPTLPVESTVVIVLPEVQLTFPHFKTLRSALVVS